MEPRGSTDIGMLRDEINIVGANALSLEGACDATAGLLYRTLPDMVLVRLFATVPLRLLDPFADAFARRLASTAGVAERLRDDTPVLTLMGTQGSQAAWCDRKASAGHVAIPLVSSEFVASIPMLSRAMTQLKLGITWLDRSGRPMLQGNRQRAIFYVADPRTERDELSRLVIPGQDFVRDHDVNTAFGLCTSYTAHSVLLFLVAFSRARIPRNAIAALTPAMDALRSATTSMIARDRLFSPRSGAVQGG